VPKSFSQLTEIDIYQASEKGRRRKTPQFEISSFLPDIQKRNKSTVKSCVDIGGEAELEYGLIESNCPLGPNSNNC
jgi:hypothetical protein